MDEDGPEWDGHEFWKMKISSFHKDESSGKRWVVGTWFYSPSQLKMQKVKREDKYDFFTAVCLTETLILFIEAYSHSWEMQSLRSQLIGT